MCKGREKGRKERGRGREDRRKAKLKRRAEGRERDKKQTQYKDFGGEEGEKV